MIHCPNCAAGLRFEIESQQMVCSHCDSHFDPAALDYQEKDDAKGAAMFDTFVYVCPSCGAELMTTDETDAVGFCPFCGGASMLFDKLRRQWRPDCVIPFQITKEECKKQYVKAARKSVFTSKKYSDPALIDGFRGIYMPFWEYQAVQAGRYVLKGETKDPFTIHTYEITGDIDYTIDGYAHDASLAFDDRISENITPYDISGHKPFVPGYLSGFYADIGDVDQWRFYGKGRDCMEEDTARVLAQEKSVTGSGTVRKIRVSAQEANIPTEIKGAKRVLYPVWFMSYRNKNHITYAAVNGQTGKVSADFPISPLRVVLASLLLGAIFAALVFIMPSVKANVTLLITTLLLVAGFIILGINYKRVVNPSTGLDQTPEALRFKKRSGLRIAAVVICAVLGAAVWYADPAYNIISYSLCLLMAAVLFLLLFFHVRFQIAIAKRRPPQFNKKGAEGHEA